MSLVPQDEPAIGSKVVAIDTKTGPQPRKVLEEDEYLDRMGKIIRRDFFLESEPGTPLRPHTDQETSCRSGLDTPGTDRTDFTATSSVKSSRDLRSMRLNEYLDKYTSEDNAYFDKLQRKELKRHRFKYPWLYTIGGTQSKRPNESPLQLRSGSLETLAIEGPSGHTKRSELEWRFNKNSLFHPPDQPKPTSTSSTVNYKSSKYMQKVIFKEPSPWMPKPAGRVRGTNRFSDKIGIDGRLLNGSETPSMNGYSFVPPPDTPKVAEVEEPRLKLETNRFYIPCNSPRDDLAHRLYEQKVTRAIRTPKTSTRSDSTKTPSSRLNKLFS